ncbi:MAG: hypothetical protein GYB64_11680 [Chloroflexi bacterium]|nr:hypothetical protein [Chloroflexota bacterium]
MYEETAHEYLELMEKFMGEEAEGDVTFRSGGAEEADPEVMTMRAEAIAEKSQKMLEEAKPMLDDENRAKRSWMTGQFLAQAAAEIEVAAQLLATAADEGAEEVEAMSMRSGDSTTKEAMGNLKTMMHSAADEKFAEQDAVAFRSGGTEAPADMEEARALLMGKTREAITGIAGGTAESGLNLFLGLVAQKAPEVLNSATAGREFVTAKLDEAKAGTGEEVNKRVDAATRLLLTAYDKLITLVGRDATDEARETVKGWVDEAESEGGASMFEEQLSKLYQVEKAQTDLSTMLESSDVEIVVLTDTAAEVDEIAARYDELVLKQAATFDKVLDRVPAVLQLVKVAFAPLTAVLFALRFSLLTTLVYAGYDYIGHGQGKFLDIADGVSQVVSERLGTPPPAEEA